MAAEANAAETVAAMPTAEAVRALEAAVAPLAEASSTLAGPIGEHPRVEESRGRPRRACGAERKRWLELLLGRSRRSDAVIVLGCGRPHPCSLKWSWAASLLGASPLGASPLDALAWE